MTNPNIEKCCQNGKIRGAQSKALALANYLSNPTLCVYCTQPIQLRGRRPCEVRLTKFCSQSHSAKYNNHTNPKRISSKHFCSNCSKNKAKQSSLCYKCRVQKKKQDSALLKISSVSYRTIRDNAKRITYGRSRVCTLCNYPYAETCHIKPIRGFSKDSTLGEVNHPSNLVMLCPNHHYEFDNGLVALPGVEPGTS